MEGISKVGAPVIFNLASYAVHHNRLDEACVHPYSTITVQVYPNGVPVTHPVICDSKFVDIVSFSFVNDSFGAFLGNFNLKAQSSGKVEIGASRSQ